MNRRNFFSWMAAAIAWLVAKPKAAQICAAEPGEVLGYSSIYVREPNADELGFTKTWTGGNSYATVEQWQAISIREKG